MRARAAGVSHNAPYRHFPNRDALLVALATRGFERLAEALETLTEIPPGEARLLAIGHTYLRFAAEHPRLHRLMFGGVVERTADAWLLAARVRALAALHLPGPGMPGELRAAAVGAWALVHGLAQLRADRQLREAEAEAPDLFDRVMRIYARGLAAGPET